MKNQEEKKQWILDYMSDHENEFIDIVAKPFVNAYIDKFEPKIIEWYPYGAPKVPELGKYIKKVKRGDIVNIVNCGETDIQGGFMFII